MPAMIPDYNIFAQLTLLLLPDFLSRPEGLWSCNLFGDIYRGVVELAARRSVGLLGSAWVVTSGSPIIDKDVLAFFYNNFRNLD